MVKWILLTVAIVVEVFGTLMLKASDGFSRLWPTVGMLLAYVAAFYLESQVIQLGIPVAVTYAIWSAGGIVLVTIAARVFFRDPINLLTGLGMLVIILGVALTAVGSAQQH